MSTRSASEIAIHHLRIKGRSDEVKALIHDFETSSWPEAPAQEWVFIRNLSVKAKKAELRLQTAQAMDSARRHAVDGGSSAANQANAVRFADLSEMLAFLLRDLVNGDAVFRWYWQRWSALLREPKSQAIAQVLWEDVEALPAVVERLAKIQQLEAVWLALEPQAAALIADKLLNALGHLTSPKGEAAEAHASTIPPTIFQAMQRIPSTLRTWAPVFRRLPVGDQRVHLASCLVGVQHFPLLLIQHPQALSQVFYRSVLSMQLLAQFDSPAAEPGFRSNEADGVADTRAEPPAEPAPDNNPGARANETNITEPSSRQPRPTHEDFTAQQQPQAGSIDERSDRPQELKPSESTESSNPHIPPAVTEQSALDTGQNTVEESESLDSIEVLPGNEFHTHLGGVFYLINVLNPFVEALMLTPSAQCCGAGFRWLFELLRRFEPGEDDPILHFFARQCELESVSELLALPAIADFDAIHSTLAQRYPEIWHRDLLEVPTTVIYSASHIDCFLPLNAVRLPVRLHGLDVNPGWVPWLGRVVQFHYRESPREH